MADVTLSGFTIPSQPNFGLAVFDVDGLPEQLTEGPQGAAAIADSPLQQLATRDVNQGPDAPPVANLISLTMDASNNLVAVFDQPITIDPGTETHGGAKWDFATPTVSNTGTEGTLTQSLTRFLRRLSKLARGVN